MKEFLTVEGKKIWYRIINATPTFHEHPVLVFLHEGLGCSEQWRDFPEVISNRCGMPALVFDRYGYGQSQAKDEPNTGWYMHNEAYKFLPEILEQLGIYHKVILVGHSDGGTIALLFAGRFPEKTLAVVSECDHVMCEEITIRGVQQVVQSYELGQLKPLLQKYHGEKTDSLFYGWTGFWLSDKAKSWDITREVEAVKAPLLAIQGENDGYGSVEQLVVKLRHAKGPVQINLLDGCGHVPHHEQPERVTELMVQFINSVTKDL